MKFLTITLIFAMGAAAPALAHMGHLGEVAGHSHLIGYGALGLAAAIAVAAARAGKRRKKGPVAQDGATDGDREPGEQAASGAKK